MTAIKTVEDGSLIVFIDGSNLHLTPKSVQDSISHAPLSATPIVSVFDPAIEKNFGVLGYRAIRKRDGFKDILAEIAKLRGEVRKT
ncbi:MAG: hypothetical protein P1U85_15295 [Verrucomicrobiales bacterium]|nr:hypothetical protein [Verrucomicrobiales bacterium]